MNQLAESGELSALLAARMKLAILLQRKRHGDLLGLGRIDGAAAKGWLPKPHSHHKLFEFKLAVFSLGDLIRLSNRGHYWIDSKGTLFHYAKSKNYKIFIYMSI